MKIFFLFLFALIGVPFLGALVLTAFELILPEFLSTLLFTPLQWWFVAGCAGMVIIYCLWGQKLAVIDTFAHELTHALAGILCGSKIYSMTVKTDGNGNVVQSKNNIFITLAPYCIPLYFLFLVLIRWPVERFAPGIIPHGVWNLLQGFFLTFHILYTVDTLVTVAQPDVREYGRFFSYWYILCANLLFLTLTLCITLPIPFRVMLKTLLSATLTSYTTVFTWLKHLYTLIA